MDFARNFPRCPGSRPPPEKALLGIRRVVADAVADMKASGEPVPEALAEKKFSGRFMVRIPSSVHRALATEAAEQGLSINRLVSAKLTASVVSTRHPTICSQGSSTRVDSLFQKRVQSSLNNTCPKRTGIEAERRSPSCSTRSRLPKRRSCSSATFSRRWMRTSAVTSR